MSSELGREASWIYSTSEGVMKDALDPSVIPAFELGPSTSPNCDA